MPVRRGQTLGLLRRLREAGTVPRKQRLGRIPRRQLPDRIGGQYSKALIRDVCRGALEAFKEVEGEVLALLRGLREEQGHQDVAPRGVIVPLTPEGGEPYPAPPIGGTPSFAAAEWRGRKAAELIDRAARIFKKKLHPAALHEVVKQFGKATDAHSRQQLDQQLRSAIGVPLSSIEKPMQDKLGQWNADNVALIVTVPERYFDRLQQDVQEAFAGGTHPNTLKEELQERYEMSERDAERIARDQVLKLSADLNHARMEAIGVEKAIWRTMRDNRVCDECYAKDGEEFALAEGLGGCLPGECHPEDRCYSEPVLDLLLGNHER